jgi:peptidoglycan hydrolase-like protein with peptidoglycan-binding domain
VKRAKFIIFLCVFLASGCTLFDSAETEPEKSLGSAPAPADETLAVEVAAEKPTQEASPMPPRSLTRDEVRQVQLRLKNAGYDPGPVDGVAGTRTKAAFSRYHTGCDKVKLVLDDFDDTGAPAKSGNALGKPLGYNQVQTVQSQLRAAGFDPGPADGIFGARTKRALAQLKANCPMMKEFAVALNDPATGADNKSITGQTTVPGYGSTKASATTAAPAAVTQHTTTVAPGWGTEETRILQLRLRDAGFDPGAFDGVMGPKTKSALQQYEASQRGKKIKTSLTGNISGQY